MKLLSLVSVAVVLVTVYADEDKEKMREWFCKKATESAFAQKVIDCMDKTYTPESKEGWEHCKMEVHDEKLDDAAFLLKMCQDHKLTDMALDCYTKSGHFPTMEVLKAYGECVMHIM